MVHYNVLCTLLRCRSKRTISTYFSALHSLIGVGFLVATFLVTPFLPEDKPDNNQTDNVCNTSSEDSNSDGSTAIDFADSEHNVPLLGVPKLAWPFIISGTWCMVFSCGYAILGEEDFLFLWKVHIFFLYSMSFLGCLPYEMPRFYEETPSTDSKERSGNVGIRYWKPLLFLTFFYYVISCGIERIYQPMVFKNSKDNAKERVNSHMLWFFISGVYVWPLRTFKA